MPELPEVETVRQGLHRWVSGRTVSEVEIRHPRAVRRHVLGADDLVARLVGMRFGAAARRGKYLWLPVSGERDRHGQRGRSDDVAHTALIAHLGMSGQLLVQPAGSEQEKHLHVRIGFADDGPELRFVDQRTFGGLMLDELVPAVGQSVPENGGALVPSLIAHIARDPLDPAFDDEQFLVKLRRRDSAIKRALLDQTLLSGVGNIYADEALWRTKLNGERIAATLRRPVAVELLAQVRAVLTDALVAGGTSFDSLYVNVNGESGYFGRELAVYGREGEPCLRCGTAIRRASFMNRSSFFCPRCQRPPRRA